MPKKVAAEAKVVIRDERTVDAKAGKREAAARAVQKFEELRSELVNAEGQFQQDFPEASQALRDIEQLRDDVGQAINQAKPLIADLGESIGDFTVSLKYTKPHYDEAKFAKVMSELDSENLGDVFKALFDAGVIKSVGLDKDALGVFFPRNPEVQEGFVDAFDAGGKALTPAVTVPKV